MKGHLLLSWKLRGFLHPHSVTKHVRKKEMELRFEASRKEANDFVFLFIARVFQAPLEGLHAVAAE